MPVMGWQLKLAKLLHQLQLLQLALVCDSPKTWVKKVKHPQEDEAPCCLHPRSGQAKLSLAHACRPINQRYFAEMARVSFRLLEVLAIGLGLQPTALHHLFQPSHTSFLRLNHYPVTPGAAPDSLGISPHKDAGFLTVLVQDDVSGLQVGQRC